MGAIVGFILGYVLGTRAGAQGERDLRDAWSTITSSAEVKDMLAGALSALGDLLRQGRGVLAERLQVPDEGVSARISRIA